MDAIAEEPGMKLGTWRVSDAMDGPDPERYMVLRMHVLSRNDQPVLVAGDEVIHHRENVCGVRNSEGAAFHNIVLNVDHQEGGCVARRGWLHILWSY
jgi:hypothetical protein